MINKLELSKDLNYIIKIERGEHTELKDVQFLRYGKDKKAVELRDNRGVFGSFISLWFIIEDLQIIDYYEREKIYVDK